MENIQYAILFFIGIGAGFINTLAGGGSIITVSTMILFGVPSTIANGTNRIALLFQNTSATLNFKQKGYFDGKSNIAFAIPAIVGSVIGSNIAVKISDEVFNKALAIIMILILLEMIIRPKIKKDKDKDKDKDKESKNVHRLVGSILFFFVGLYGGIMQAGVGFVVIGVLGLISNYDLVKINAIKVFVIGSYTIAALIVFILNDKVDYKLGIIIAVGNAIGAYLGSNFAVAKGDKWIKIILSITIVVLAIRLLFGFK